MIDSIDHHASKLVNISIILAVVIIATHITFLILIFGANLEYFYGLDYQFHLDGEYNIPAIFSTLMLAFSVYLLAHIYFKSNKNETSGYWLVLAVIFLFLAADELLSFHELLILPLRNYFNLTDYLYFSWVIVGVIFVISILFSSRTFLKSLPGYYSKRFLIAGLIFVSGVIVMEMIGAKVAYDSGYEYGWISTKERGLTYAIIITIEETLEICGIVYFNFLLVKFMNNYNKF